ncbi:MAG: Gfo/Idh/MocA family oxidoreductase [Bacteroidia bacterium]|nr:Gfo/Idh/MocA family oxidoreductase [Bacteroidia bacterium]
MHYKIGIIGLGSIGIRHLKNLQDILIEKGCTFCLDAIRHDNSNQIEASVQDKLNAIYVLDEAIPDDYDILFVTNPTSMHYSTIQRFARNTKHMFIEKPVFSSTNLSLQDLGLLDGSQYYVACPLRYKKVLQYLKSQDLIHEAISVRVICSSFLPDWRPGKDYRETYSAHLAQGGGVAIDLIHEWDYITYLFGEPEEVKSIISKVSSLEIDSDDLAVYIAKYPSMVLELHLDYFGRVPKRTMEIFTINDVIIVDLLSDSIRFLREGTNMDFPEDRDSYQKRELQHFFNIIEKRENNDNSIINAQKILKLARGATV